MTGLIWKKALYCPNCAAHSLWGHSTGQVHWCVACNSRVAIAITTENAMDHIEKETLRQVRVAAGCGDNSSVGAFG